MAKRKKDSGENLSQYFRELFSERPDWVTTKSNKEIVARYNSDHPGEEASQRVKQNLANIKSLLRRDSRGVKARAKASGTEVAMEAVEENARDRDFESLETAIDDCLLMAKNMDRTGLGHVIEHLRMARNLVVWKLGS